MAAVWRQTGDTRHKIRCSGQVKYDANIKTPPRTFSGAAIYNIYCARQRWVFFCGSSLKNTDFDVDVDLSMRGLAPHSL
jgi:hypothetical protein